MLLKEIRFFSGLISRLSLENFKGVKHGSIDLAPLTILLGSNNSGKTTILEALFLAPNPVRRAYYRDYVVDVVRGRHETLPASGYAFLLYRYDAPQATIKCIVDGKEFLLRLLSDGNFIYLLSNREYPSFSTEVRGEKIPYFARLSISGDISNITYRAPFIEDTLLVSSDLRREAYEALVDRWGSIRGVGICGKIARELSELTNEKYVNVTVEPWFAGGETFYILLESGEGRRLGDLGDGAQMFVVARLLYELAQPSILLWDDVEAHLNPRILSWVAQWFSDLLEAGKQVIVSTHSLEAARNIAGFNEDKTKIYLTSLEDGELKARRFTLREVEELLEAGVDVRLGEPVLL